MLLSSQSKIHRFITNTPRVNGWKEIETKIHGWLLNVGAKQCNTGYLIELPPQQNSSDKPLGGKADAIIATKYKPLVLPTVLSAHEQAEISEKDTASTDVSPPSFRADYCLFAQVRSAFSFQTKKKKKTKVRVTII